MITSTIESNTDNKEHDRNVEIIIIYYIIVVLEVQCV